MRIERGRPWCWQYKEVLREIKRIYKTKPQEKLKMKLLYCTITEIENDQNGMPFKNFSSIIRTYSGLPEDWIPKGLRQLADMGVIEICEKREGGRFKGRYLQLNELSLDLPVPANKGKKPDKTGFLPLETVTGKTGSGNTGTIEEQLKEEEQKKINYRPVWDFYNKRYTEITGDKAVINYAKASQVLRPYVEKDGPEETVRKMGTWFDMEIGKWCGYAIYNYATDYAKIVLANGKGGGGKIDYGFDKLDM